MLLHLSEPWYNVSTTKDFKEQLGRSKETGSVKAPTTAPGHQGGTFFSAPSDPAPGCRRLTSTISRGSLTGS